jgi:hypothetical protein
MSRQPWTKAQAKNNKKFQAQLDKLTNYLIDGDWHSSYSSETDVEGDVITNVVGKPEDLRFATLEFSRLPGGALLATETELDESGELVTEGFVVGLQPSEGTFYMISLDDNDLIFGDICKKSGIINVTAIEQSVSGDEARLEIIEYTNLGM